MVERSLGALLPSDMGRLRPRRLGRRKNRCGQLLCLLCMLLIGSEWVVVGERSPACFDDLAWAAGQETDSGGPDGKPEASATLRILPFGIRAVDEANGRGVPLVELTTVNGIKLITDNNGWAAFYEPDLMGRDVFFYVRSHGYEFPKGGFGFAGVRLKAEPGKTATIFLKRLNLAERLYRITGQGTYRDSLLLGQPVPEFYRPLPGGVMGCDSVLTAVFRGRLYWFWGDTHRPSYPLGNFWTTGATSPLPDQLPSDPDKGIALEYFVGEDGFVRAMAPISQQGPVWLNGPVVLRDEDGTEVMFAHYAVIDPKSRSFEPIERGLARFDPEKNVFERVRVFPPDASFPDGAHPIICREGRREYVYFCNPFPLLRVPADCESLSDPSHYEVFSPLVEDSLRSEAKIDRRADGTVCWAWKKNVKPTGPPQVAELVRKGGLQPKESKLIVYDVLSGRPVVAHRGSLAWNTYRRCFVMIFTELAGSSFLGEVWYAEGDSLQGPWGYAQKIVTHQQYSFYNPKHHPYFDKENGRLIYFEGTFSASFSDAPVPTPYYDYNQIMYRLDLAEPRLRLPIPVYQVLGPGGKRRLVTRWHRPEIGKCGGDSREVEPAEVRFWAWDRPGENFRPVYAKVDADGVSRLQVVETNTSSDNASEILFYVLAPEADLTAESCSALSADFPVGRTAGGESWRYSVFPKLRPVHLVEWRKPDGTYVYLLENEPAPPGATSTSELGKVFPHPEN